MHMHVLTLLAVIVLIGYTLVIRPNSKPAAPPASPDVLSDTDPSDSPEPSQTPLPPKLPSTPTPKPQEKSNSRIDVDVDTRIDDATPAAMELIYPGATKTGDRTYETDADGDPVYEWYKAELGKRSFQIRNNVRTKANEKFKAVLQGVSGSESIKVTIDQEHSGAKTKISLE